MNPNPLQKIDSTLDFLYEELSWAYLFYFTAKALNQANQRGKMLFRNYLFASAYKATLNEAVLVLSKLVISDKDSISFEYLFNLIDQASDLFPHASKATVQSALNQHRNQLNSHQPLISQIISQRDKRLAHADRDLINQPEKMAAEPMILMDEVERCLKDLLAILSTYNNYLRQADYGLSVIQENAQRDVDYVVSIYAQGQTGVKNIKL